MILYFSGTGNSKYVAQRITDALGDEIVNLTFENGAAWREAGVVRHDLRQRDRQCRQI